MKNAIRVSKNRYLNADAITGVTVDKERLTIAVEGVGTQVTVRFETERALTIAANKFGVDKAIELFTVKKPAEDKPQTKTKKKRAPRKKATS